MESVSGTRCLGRNSVVTIRSDDAMQTSSEDDFTGMVGKMFFLRPEFRRYWLTVRRLISIILYMCYYACDVPSGLCGDAAVRYKLIVTFDAG